MGKSPEVSLVFFSRARAVVLTGRFEPDEALQNSVLGFNTARPTRGSFDVKEVFAELRLPIISDSFIHELTLNGAARYSDYSTVGGVETYSAGVEFAPIRDIRFRAQYQRAGDGGRDQRPDASAVGRAGTPRDRLFPEAEFLDV